MHGGGDDGQREDILQLCGTQGSRAERQNEKAQDEHRSENVGHDEARVPGQAGQYAEQSGNSDECGV